jgi:hypothetical protein
VNATLKLRIPFGREIKPALSRDFNPGVSRRLQNLEPIDPHLELQRYFCVWLGFLDTYRTPCITPVAEIVAFFEELRVNS